MPVNRWGDRLFECDLDCDLVAGFDKAFKKEKYQLPFSQAIKSEAAKDLIADMREKLDGGLGTRYFDRFRNLQASPKSIKSVAMYETVLLAAVFMRVGAKIRGSDKQHLEGLIAQIAVNGGLTLIDYHDGWRAAGKAQFTAALENYKAGTPRDFAEPSCFFCGKTKTDTGLVPDKCGRCLAADYCGRECQKKNWPAHKFVCSPPDNLTIRMDLRA